MKTTTLSLLTAGLLASLPAPATLLAANAGAGADTRAAAAASLPGASTPRNDFLDTLGGISSYRAGDDTSGLKQLDDAIRQSDAAGKARFATALRSLAARSEAALSDGAKSEISVRLGWLDATAGRAEKSGKASAAPDLTTAALSAATDDVALLRRWASEPGVAEAAIAALALIQGPAAENALVELIDAAPPHWTPSVLAALAELRSATAVEPVAIAARASATPAPTRDAAISCLGQIGTPAAVKALRSLPASPATDEQVGWALLRAGNRLAADGRTADARRLLGELLRAPASPVQRRAAAEELVATQGANGLKDTFELLRENSADAAYLAPAWLRSAATEAKARSGPAALRKLAKAMPGLAARTQISLLRTAEQLAQPALLPVVEAVLASSIQEVRVAALDALGACAHDLRSTQPLFAALEKPAERAVAIAALSRSPAPGIDASVRERAASAEPQMQSALLTIASNRVDRDAMSLVLTAAAGDNAEIRQGAYRAMGKLVRGEDLEMLLQLRPKLRAAAERRGWQEAVLNSVRFRTDNDAVVDLVERQLQDASPADRGTFAIALTLLEGDKSAGILLNLVRNNSVESRKEVVRALSSARNPKSAVILIDVAEHAADQSERILALRGYLDTLPELESMPQPDRVACYRRAWGAANRPEERDAIIATVSELWGDEAKELAKQLRAERETAPSAAASAL